MNKFFILSIVALVSVASASVDDDVLEEFSQAGIIAPTDTEETAHLQGEMKILSKFCIETRDYVVRDMTTKTDNLLSTVFNTFMQTAKEIAEEGVQTGAKSASRLAPQLANPSAAIETANEDEIDRIIAEGQLQIQNGSKGEGIIAAFKSAFIAMSTSVAENVSKRLNALKTLANSLTIEGAFNDVCDRSEKYQTEMMEMLELIRDQLPERVQSVQFNDIPCATSSKIFLLNNGCNLAKMASTPATYVTNMVRMLRGKPNQKYEDDDVDAPGH